MTSGSNNRFTFRKAKLSDLDPIKALADLHRNELGFVLRPALEKSIIENEIIIAEARKVLIGFAHYRHRRDQQTTLYHIVVHADFRGHGVGKRLIKALHKEASERGKKHILAKCPVSLEANKFYSRADFNLDRTEDGKSRPLNVWMLSTTTNGDPD